MTELAYRPLDPADLPEFTELVSDFALVRQLGSFPWPPEPDFTANRCKPYDGDGFVWGVFQNGGLIGTVGVTDATLGYCFALRTAGQGIATRAATHALTHAFANPALDHIGAKAWADNSGSLRVLAKLGFVETERTIEQAKARGVPTPSVTLTLTRSRWHDTRLRTLAQ